MVALLIDEITVGADVGVNWNGVLTEGVFAEFFPPSTLLLNFLVFHWNNKP